MTIMTCMTHDMYDFSLVFFVCHSSSRGTLKSTSDYCFRLKHETGKITSQISCLDTFLFFQVFFNPGAPTAGPTETECAVYAGTTKRPSAALAENRVHS